MKKEKSDVCYEYKDGRFLKACYIGDGEFEIVLTEKISKDCMVSIGPWPKYLDAATGYMTTAGISSPIR